MYNQELHQTKLVKCSLDELTRTVGGFEKAEVIIRLECGILDPVCGRKPSRDLVHGTNIWMTAVSF